MLHLDHILVAYDYSPFANRALARGLRLARRFGAELHVFYADVLFSTPYVTDTPAQNGKPVEVIRGNLITTVEAYAEAHAIALDALTITYAVDRDVAAAPAILRYADEHPIDLIVIGTHGRRGVSRLLLGSVAEEVLRQAPCPVLTVHRGATDDGTDETHPIREILVPVDFSPHAREALHLAREVAALLEARLTLLHVIQDPLHPAFYNTGVFSIYDVDPDIEDKARAQLRTFYDETPGPAAPPERVPLFEALPGHPGHEITEYANEHTIDLIMMATHGRTGLQRFVMGSVAERTARRAPCAVFSVKSFGRSLLRPASAADTATAS
jgi:nucleotide-binding universal stress UspA family protein